MTSRCSQSFYDALGGKHRSRELFAVVVGESGPATSYEIVSGMSAGKNEISVDDLAQLCCDGRLTVTVHKYGIDAVIPFNPDSFRGRQARIAFDAGKARAALGDSYSLWLESCARNLPATPSDSLGYTKKIAEAYLADLSGAGIAFALAHVPGVLAAGPAALSARFWGNSGMVDAAASVLIGRITPNSSAREVALLCEYLCNISEKERSALTLKALERLGIWDSSAPVTGSPLSEKDTNARVSLEADLGTGPSSPSMDTLRAKALLLELDLGVPGLATLLGCSTDSKQSQLSTQDLEQASMKRHPVGATVQADVDLRAAEVTRSVVYRHNLVSYVTEIDVQTIGGFEPNPGDPRMRGRKALVDLRLVGLTTDGHVLSFAYVERSESLLEHGDARHRADSDAELVSRHPSVDDAIRGSQGEYLNDHEESEESREHRARLLARLPIGDHSSPLTWPLTDLELATAVSFLKEQLPVIRELYLPAGRAAVAGSLVLVGVPGIEPNDIDILCDQGTWNAYSQDPRAVWRITTTGARTFSINGAEFFTDLPGMLSASAPTVAEALATTEIRWGVPFLSVACMRAWKIRAGRVKDLEHVRLVDHFLKRGGVIPGR